jgi:hypothetical protein
MDEIERGHPRFMQGPGSVGSESPEELPTEHVIVSFKMGIVDANPGKVQVEESPSAPAAAHLTRSTPK